MVTVYDAGELDDGRPYLVMSYADQGTLADRLEVEGLTVGQSLEVVRQVGLGLQGAARPRGAAPRREAGERAVPDRRPGPRAGRGDVRAMLGDLGLGKAMDMSSRLTMIAGTPDVRRPRAGAGRAAGRARRPVLPGRAHLPAVHRPGAVRPREPGRGGRAGAAAAAVGTRARVPRRGRARSWPGAVAGPRGALARRHGVRRGPARGARGRRPRGDAGALAAAGPRAHPARRAPDPRPDAKALADPTPPPPRRARRLAAVCAGSGRWPPAVRSGTRCYGTGNEDAATVSDDTRLAERDGPRGRGTRVVASDGWRPPTTGPVRRALRRHRRGLGPADSEDEGVFLGILPGTELPDPGPPAPRVPAGGVAGDRRGRAGAVGDRGLPRLPGRE